MPKVTVLMPVYNGEDHLRDAMESILQQTFTDFEFLIIDDGSTDQSVSIVRSYRDPRIRIIRNETNLKLVNTLNKGIDLAKGKYIARMDCDDISLPGRLRAQVELLDQNPSIGLCGTAAMMMNDRGIVRHPEHHNDIRCQLLFNSSFIHPTVMIRKSVLTQYKLYYDSTIIYAQDYDLWVCMSEVTLVRNLPEVLLHYRVHKQQISVKYGDQQLDYSKKTMQNQLMKLGLEPTAEEMTLHMRIARHSFRNNRKFVRKARKWFDKIINANLHSGYLNHVSLSTLLDAFWNKIKKEQQRRERKVQRRRIQRKRRS